jgi:hypothetical protein
MPTESTSLRTLRMRYRLTWLLGVIGLAGACGQPTAPDRVTLEVELALVSTPTAELTYYFTVLNASAATIYLPACADVVRPTIHIVGPGDTRDRLSLMCPANVSMSAVALAPGARYEGSGLLTPRQGARFTPSVSYARAPGNLPSFAATAPSFASP